MKDKKFYMKHNSYFAVSVAGCDDINLLHQLGVEKMGEIARYEESPTMEARISRLVNSGYVPEGFY